MIDFVGGPVGYRFRRGSSRQDALARAVGLHHSGPILTVVDATAGLGRDAFLLAALGAQVTLVERSSLVHGLLRSALEKAREATPDLAAVVARMTLVHGDSRDLLCHLHPDVVTVDPMHPPRAKSALVKQDMRRLRQIVGVDADAFELMCSALANARRRVVLKWPVHADLMPGLPEPSYRIMGKTVRYDVFTTTPTDGQTRRP